MRYSLRLITAPATEPVTAAEAKLHAHINHDIENSLISQWIKAAREEAEDFQRRAFISQVWELSFDGFPILPVQLPRSPAISVETIKYYDTANTETVLYRRVAGIGETIPATSSDFLIDLDSEPARIALSYLKIWPATLLRELNALKIRYTAGYGTDATTVPASVKDAIMLYCSYRNENRIGEDEFPKQFYDLLRKDRMFI